MDEEPFGRCHRLALPSPAKDPIPLVTGFVYDAKFERVGDRPSNACPPNASPLNGIGAALTILAR
ncbi:MAG: hypothetical protein ACSLE6_05460 [Mycobacterium sp.]